MNGDNPWERHLDKALDRLRGLETENAALKSLLRKALNGYNNESDWNDWAERVKAAIEPKPKEEDPNDANSQNN